MSPPTLAQLAARLARFEERVQTLEADAARVSGQVAQLGQSVQAVQRDHARGANQLRLLWDFVASLRETLIRLAEVKQP